MEGMEIKRKRREKFKDKMKELVSTEAKDLGVHLRMGFGGLRRTLWKKTKESEEAHGGGMRKCKKQ